MGNIALGYYANDLVASIRQDGQARSFALAPGMRRWTETLSDAGGAVVSTLTRSYTDTSDNPAWVTDTKGASATTTRYVAGQGGGLALTMGAQRSQVMVADLQGTIATTITLPGSASAGGAPITASSPTALQESDEYGNLLPATSGGANPTPVGTGQVTYAWHGQSEHARTTAGLVLMGARVYNSGTGQFTSRDPVLGGNTTAYAHPQDHINNTDLDGQRKIESRWRKALGVGLFVAGIAGAIACGTSIVCGVAVGATVGAASYSARTAGTGRWSFPGVATSAAFEGIGGQFGIKGMGALARLPKVRDTKRIGRTNHRVRLHFDEAPHPFEVGRGRTVNS